MNVAFGFNWHVVIDHVRDASNIDAARCNVRRDEDIDAPAAKCLKGFLPSVLSFVSMNCNRSNSDAVQLLCQGIGTMFCASEYDCLIDSVAKQHVL